MHEGLRQDLDEGAVFVAQGHLLLSRSAPACSLGRGTSRSSWKPEGLFIQLLRVWDVK